MFISVCKQINTDENSIISKQLAAGQGKGNSPIDVDVCFVGLWRRECVCVVKGAHHGITTTIE